ncbi:MAG: YihY family inner membrane protein [Planctomycetes bacterium]|nr:YihY family inner membrane protein [Planctomycetota bacterium]MBU1518639.1 YihY family inner membrane protein [Planctomycetota bacterium]MBU2458141.1 YihY family inner membrane protein [Planctomycetota bacterium]MBU2597174.1 YihY family inner membrane protein [Planctomycetota bacterium]
MFEKMVSVPTSELSRFTRFIFFQIRLWPQCIKLLLKNKANQQAAVLSYNTIFGIVPLAIVMLLIFNSLGAFDELGSPLRNFLYEQSFIKNIQYPVDANNPTEKVTLAQKIDEFTAGFYDNLNKGSITVISCAVIIWAAIALLSTIENSFNMIWGVGRGRNFIQRVTNYWGFLTLGPLLFGVAVYVNARYSIAGNLSKSVFTYIGPVMPFLVAFVGLFALYMLMPNAKVSSLAAVWGALIAASAWMFAKWAFGLYVVKLIPYSIVYGVLGLIPLGVLWIYITWLIVLFGLQLTFTTQNLKTIEEAEKAASKRRQDYFLATDLQIAGIMKFIYAAFEKKNAPVPSELICSQLNLPPDFTQKVLTHLVKAGLLLKTTDPSTGFAPATVAENVKLSDIYDAVKNASFVAPGDQSAVINQITNDYKQTLSQYTVKNLM